MEIARSLHCWIFGKRPFGSFHRLTSLLFSLFVCCRSKLRNVLSDFQLDHYSASDMRDFNADKYLPAAIKGAVFFNPGGGGGGRKKEGV